MKDKKFISYLVIIFGLFILVGLLKPKPIDWTSSYKHDDKIPFGTYILFEELTSLFREKDITILEKTIYESLALKRKNTNYIGISETINLDDLDLEVLLEYVNGGNNAFLACHHFDEDLLDTLGIELAYDYNFGSLQEDSIKTELHFLNKAFEKDSTYSFTSKYYDVYSFFRLKKGELAYSLSANEKGRVNFVKVPYGMGYFYLNSSPEYFSNYYMSDGRTFEYVAKCLSFLPEQNVFWDAYYGKGNIAESETPMRFILSNPALKSAWFLLLGLGLFYILFQSKRKQRAIPVVVAPQNSTLSFTKTIGNLYFKQNNHKNLAEKKIAFFLDHLRTRYFMKTEVLDENFKTRLIQKSTLDEQFIENLLAQIKLVGKSASISEAQLIKLNKTIESFYNKTK